jgi:DNA repair protein RadC
MIVSRERAELSCSTDVGKHLRKILNKEDSLSREREHFWVITLSAQNRVKFVELVSIGTINYAVVHPREVFRRAIKNGATSLIVGHNHPSGAVKPSTEDISLTKKLKEAGSIVGIEVLDHVIIGDRTLSFKEEGLI